MEDIHGRNATDIVVHTAIYCMHTVHTRYEWGGWGNRDMDRLSRRNSPNICLREAVQVVKLSR